MYHPMEPWLSYGAIVAIIFAYQSIFTGLLIGSAFNFLSVLWRPAKPAIIRGIVFAVGLSICYLAGTSQDASVLLLMSVSLALAANALFWFGLYAINVPLLFLSHALAGSVIIAGLWWLEAHYETVRSQVTTNADRWCVVARSTSVERNSICGADHSFTPAADLLNRYIRIASGKFESGIRDEKYWAKCWPSTAPRLKNNYSCGVVAPPVWCKAWVNGHGYQLKNLNLWKYGEKHPFEILKNMKQFISPEFVSRAAPLGSVVPNSYYWRGPRFGTRRAANACVSSFIPATPHL